MKKVVLLMVALVMCLALCACGSGGSPESSPTSQQTHNSQHTHNWKAANCENPKTCLTCGETEGAAAGHNWKAANCENPKTCLTCGETEGIAAGHDWKAANCANPKTCLTCGETEGAAAGHDWKVATCSKPKTCKICGETEGGVANHDYEVTKTVNATCESEGYKKYMCTYCGDTYTEDIAKSGHNYMAATCTSPKKCKDCGATSGESESHKDGGNGYCTYCNENMNLALAKQKLYVKLMVPSSGTNNAYLTWEIRNHTGYTVYLPAFVTGNGKLCYNSNLSDYELESGYKMNATYYRGIIPSERYDDKNYDMYLDDNSWAYLAIDVNGTDVYIKMNGKGDTVWGLSRSDIGVA